VCGVLGAVAGCAGLLAGKSGPFWSTEDLGASVPPPSGLLAAVLADRPSPRAPLPEELQAVAATPPIRLERVLGRRAMDPAREVAFLPDGRRLLALAGNGDLAIWDPITRTRLAAFPACEKGMATSLLVSPDGKLAANITSDHRLCVRDLADGHVVRAWEAHAAPIRAAAFTTGGELLSYAYQPEYWAETQLGPIREQREAGGELRRWRLDQERPANEFVLGPASTVVFSADGGLIVANDVSGKLRALDGAGRKLWTGGASHRFRLVDHDRQLLAVERAEIDALDARTGRPLGAFVATTPLTRMFMRQGESPVWGDCITIAPDGRHLITALHEDPFFFVWDLATRREVAHVHGRNFPACGGTFSPDGTVLATSDLQLWDATARLPLPDRAIYGLAVSADGRRAITDGSDMTMRLWDLDRGAETARRRLSKGTSVKLSAAGDRMLLGSEDGGVRLADVATGAEIWSWDGGTSAGPCALSPDGRLAVTSTLLGVGLTVHDVTTGKGLWNTPLPDYEGAAAAFSPDSRLLAYTDRYHQLCVRAARDGREVRRLPGVKRRWSLAFSPDGRYLLADASEIVIFDLGADGQEVRRIEYPGGMTALGADLLVFSRHEGARVIDLSRISDGAALGKITLGEHFGVVTSLALAAGGTRLVVGTSRGHALVFALRGGG